MTNKEALAPPGRARTESEEVTTAISNAARPWTADDEEQFRSLGLQGKRPPTEAALLRFRGESTHESVAVPKLNGVVVNELFGRFNSGGIVRVIVQKLG
jgi:hypothetical protein